MLLLLLLALAGCDATGELASREATTVNEFTVDADGLTLTGDVSVNAGDILAGDVQAGGVVSDGSVEATGPITMSATPQVSIGAVSAGAVDAGAVTATGPVELTGSVDLGPVEVGSVSATVDLSVSGGGLGVPVADVVLVYVAPSPNPELGVADIQAACGGGVLVALHPVSWQLSTGFLAVIDCP